MKAGLLFGIAAVLAPVGVSAQAANAGTVYFRGGGCESAIQVVFRQFELAGRIEPDSVVTVRRGEAQ